jgi:ribonuclease Z
MKVVFLGTGCGMPSTRRSLPALALCLRKEILLFDAGEGVQHQLQLANLSLQRISEIYISHLHGDHCLGLPGLISTMSLLHRKKPLSIIGPPGVKSFVNKTLEMTHVELLFQIKTSEVVKTILPEQPLYSVEVLPAKHSVPALSFVLRMSEVVGRFNPGKALQLGVPKGPLWKKLQQGRSVRVAGRRIVHPTEVLGPSRKGASIAYSGDTCFNTELASAARGVSLLIHEATYTNALKEKASENHHSTAAQAAEIAVLAEAKQLALVHISPRYENNQQHEQEAKSIFQQSIAPKDLDVIELNHPVSNGS